MDKAVEQLSNVNYQFNDLFGLIFIDQIEHNRVSDILSNLRRTKEITYYEYSVLSSNFKHYYNNYYKIKNLERMQPRFVAQKFIGKREVRQLVFNRDGNKCLCCGSNKRLSIDHVIPIDNNGDNSIENLQTLCVSCNSKKGTKVIDYR